MKVTGAEAVIESLRKEQVQVVFGYPGGAVLSLYDALYRMKFPHILTGHEQGAVHETQWSNKSGYWYSAVWQVLFAQYTLLQPPQSIWRAG